MVFSDIHNDLRALQTAMSAEADYYVCAGDLVNWGRGLDKMAAPMLPKAERVYVLPGNHESESDIADASQACSRRRNDRGRGIPGIKTLGHVGSQRLW
jgi:predicted phosphodiesterase